MKNNFLTKSGLLMIILAIIVFALNAGGILTIPSLVYIVIIAFAVLSYMFGLWIANSITERPALYVNRFMISMLVMMMGFLAFFGAYVYLGGEHRLEVAIMSFLSYIVLKINMVIFLKRSEKIKAIDSSK